MTSREAAGQAATKSARYGFLLIVLAAAAACGTPAGPPMVSAVASGKVTGSVTYRERIALPDDAVVQVSLLDVSRMDVAATLIAEQTIVPEHGVPIPFELSYDPDVIDARLVYAVRATIRRGDTTLFVTDTHYPVLTRGHGDEVDLVLVRSGGSAAVADVELTGTRWILRTLDGEKVQVGANQREPYLQFERQDDNGRAHGYSGCNSFTGSYLAAGSTLGFDQLLSTTRACSDMQIEDRFLEVLYATDSYLIESTWLILSGAGNELATFEAWYE